MTQVADRRAVITSLACLLCGPGLAAPAYAATAALDAGQLAPTGCGLDHGVLAVARGGRIAAEGAAGLADRESGTQLTPSSRFQIGSVSKWFTVLLVLRLMEIGRLDLRAPIGTYLDNVPAAVGARVRLVDVLSNTSGITDRLPTTFINRPDIAASRMTAAEAVSRYAQGPLEFTPGTRFDYAHTNWLVAQAIVERAGNAPIERLLQSLVFRPLGLTATGVTHGSFESVARHAVAYADSGETARRELHVIPAFLVPTGTIYSNARDLLRAAHEVYNGRFLGARARSELSTIRYAPENYALGGRVERRSIAGRNEAVAVELGSFGGFKAALLHVPEADIGAVALNNTNMDEEALSTIAFRALERLIDGGAQ